MEKISLETELRDALGTSKAKELRRQKLIPAVVYGPGKDTLNIQIKEQDFIKVLHTSAGENVVINLKIGGTAKKFKDRTVIVKEIQHYSLRDDILHVDFHEISLTERLSVKVPLALKGGDEAPGVKDGGILEHVLWEVEVECLPTDIPEKIEVDASNLAIGDAIHLKDIAVPSGVKILGGKDIVAVHCVPPVEEKIEEVPVAEEMAEPELIKQKKVEEVEAEEEEKRGAKEGRKEEKEEKK